MEPQQGVDVAAAWAGWEQAQLTQLVPQLTQNAQQMLQRSEETRNRRKVLAAETKRFRADMTAVPEALLVKFSTLVQSYVCPRALSRSCSGGVLFRWFVLPHSRIWSMTYSTMTTSQVSA